MLQPQKRYILRKGVQKGLIFFYSLMTNFHNIALKIAQPAITCSKLTIETLR